MMGLDIGGLVVLIVFYLVILVVGVFAARRYQRDASLETSIVANRDINTGVGIFTMTGKTCHLTIIISLSLSFTISGTNTHLTCA